MSFQNGTDRSGFKAALMKAFQSAHQGGTRTPTSATKPSLPQGQNVDTRPAGLLPGGPQAFREPPTRSPEVLDGGPHSSPAQTGRGPVNHNNDSRRTGLMTDGHQANRIQLTGGSATNALKVGSRKPPTLPKGQNVDRRSLRGR